jgi:very-short-patch-repair endonuclease
MREDDIGIMRAAMDGVITREALETAGYSRHSIDRRISSGLLIPVALGVYRVAGHRWTWKSRVRAAFMWAGEGALLAGATVLKLFELDGFDVAPIEIYVLNGKALADIRTRRLRDDDPVRRRPVDGMWATTIERALLDACSGHKPHQVGLAMDDALRRGLTTLGRLQKELADSARRGRRGIKAFRTLISMRDPHDQKVRSVMETKMLRILRSIRSHQFIPDLEVVGRKRYVLDFGVPALKLAIECHSRHWHGTERLDPDMARHRDLTLMGWTILYFSWDDIVFRPDEVARDIRAALASSMAM